MSIYDFTNEADRLNTSSAKINKKFVKKIFGLDYNTDTASCQQKHSKI